MQIQEFFKYSLIDGEGAADETSIIWPWKRTNKVGVQLLHSICVQICDSLGCNACSQSILSSLSKKGLDPLCTCRVQSPSLIVGGNEFLRFVEYEEDLRLDLEFTFSVP